MPQTIKHLISDVGITHVLLHSLRDSYQKNTQNTTKTLLILKKSAEDNKILKNQPACKEFILLLPAKKAAETCVLMSSAAIFTFSKD